VNAICFPFTGDERFGEGLSEALGAELAELEIHRFPDGETRVTLRGDCAGRSVVFVGGGRNPNQEALPFYFAAHAARAMGAGSLGLVTPYLPYMRQDTQFHPGEAVSALAYARFLSSSLDWMATVDPHLHRIRSLDEIFTIPALCVSSMPAVAHWIGGNVIEPVIVGPDAESRQWAESVAQALGVPWTVLTKNRAGDREVTVSLPHPAILRGRSPVIVDDIASSGHTLAAAARALRDLGSSPVTCVVVHALLDDADRAALHASGVERLVSTNTAPHGTNAIDVIPLLAGRVRAMLEGGRGTGQ